MFGVREKREKVDKDVQIEVQGERNDRGMIFIFF